MADVHPNGNGDVHMDYAGPRFATGLILPPPEIKSVIDRTASFVARSANPPQFEDKIREGQRSDPKFSFLNPADPYHGYYRHKMDRIAAGEEDNEPTTGSGEGEGNSTTDIKVIDIGIEPPLPQFIMDMPSISAIDLDTMKLTALFAARRGRNFLAQLSTNEGRNYQFDFLRPTHSLFGYFNRLVDQYTKVLHPDKDMLDHLKSRTEDGARWRTLEVAKKHAIWQRKKREKDQKREDDQEAERTAFAEIDWHDYAIVQTIEFTVADANSELPPPMSVQEVENMTLAQKRMAAMVMETTADDVEALRARQAAAEAEAAAAVSSAGVATQGAPVEEDTAMVQSDEEDDLERHMREEEARQTEIERTQLLQASSMSASSGPMKIRTDYVPKLKAMNSKSTMATCSICGQQIPVDELQEHMRIELLDPRWKEQRNALEARRAQASELLRGANVPESLKNLARTRVDIFGNETDEERRRKEEEEEKEKRKQREKVVWDGHTASKADTLDKYSTNVNFNEQIAAIHRAKGLGPADANAIGPGIGPSVVSKPHSTLPPAPASLPAPPQALGSSYSAATISSGPQPASAFPPPVMLPPLHYQGMDSATPFGFQPPGLTRSAALAAANSQLQGTIRSAEEMEGAADPIPPAKRQKVMKMPGSQIYTEQDWITMHPHPISLLFQLPKDDSKPEWKLDGTVITVPDLPLNLLVSSLRDRFLQFTGSTLPASRIRLSYAGKMLTNASTIASYNLEDEDLLVLSVGAAKKK